MKMIPSSRKNRDIAVAIIFLAVIALSVWLVSSLSARYNLTISSTEGGEVTTPGEGTFTYAEGTVVNLVAEAEEGYYFINWAGDVGIVADTGAATTTITMNGNYYVEANFGGFEMEIWDWYDLDAIRNNLSGSYILMNDLDSTTPGYAELASPTANGGKGWQPIGTGDQFFTGSFDGQGHEIHELFVNRPDQNGIGLFGTIYHGAVVENLGVVNVTVIGDHVVGGLVGKNQGTISNSYSIGSVIGDEYVGGLVGDFLNGIVSNSYSTGSVTGNSSVGGLMGWSHLGTVNNAYSTGNVTGDEHVGGLVGHTYYGTMSNSYSIASVTGVEYVGGLVGWNKGGTVSNSCFTGSVTGTSCVGGLVGHNRDHCTVTDSYFTGNVTGDEYVGGLVGDNNECTVSNSYFTGSVTGTSCVGGLVGHNRYHGTVSNSYSNGSVTGNYTVGGLVGWNDAGSVNNCYSTGSVTGNFRVGGLLGANGQNEIDFPSTVSNSYSTGSVTGNTSHPSVGGLVGQNWEGTVSDSFWDTVTSGQSTSNGGKGKATTEMQEITTFSGAGWNIIGVALNETNLAYIWNIVNGVMYPFLSWQS